MKILFITNMLVLLEIGCMCYLCLRYKDTIWLYEVANVRLLYNYTDVYNVLRMI